MHAQGRRRRWAAGGISVGLLLGGCTDSTPSADPSSETAPTTTSASRLACQTLEVRDVQVVPGDWVLAEYVLVRGPAGTRFTATLPADTPASITMGDSPEPGSSQTRTTGLTVERATVTTDPASDLDPATLQVALGQASSDPLALTNTGQDGFTGELQAQLGADGAVVFRGAKATTVTFTGDCSSASGGSERVTGSARYFELGEAGVLDCGKPTEPDTLAEAAAPFCATE
jgi:hypothetical protein